MRAFAKPLTFEDLFLRFHSKNIIHRDLKPSNITIDPLTGKPAIIDVATWLNMNRVKVFNKNYFNYNGIETYVPMGRPMQRLVGTALNMAPEIAATKLNEERTDRIMDHDRSKPWTFRYSKKSDIYALGVMLKEQFKLQDPKYWEGPPQLSLLQKEIAEFLDGITSTVPIERPSVEEILLKLYDVRKRREVILGGIVTAPNISIKILEESLKLEQIKNKLSFAHYNYEEAQKQFIEKSKKRDEDRGLIVETSSTTIDLADPESPSPKPENYAKEFFHCLTEIEALLQTAQLPEKYTKKLQAELEKHQQALYNTHPLLKVLKDTTTDESEKKEQAESSTLKKISLYLSDSASVSARAKLIPKHTPGAKDSSSSSSNIPPPSA